MKVLYSFSIRLYHVFISLAAAFGNAKAIKWIKGRKNWKQKLMENIPSGKQPIWFHVASLGEFEQARPIIEQIKREKADSFILLTFFSPSGYEIRKDYSLADYICYLPLDLTNNARLFIKTANPKLVIFVKYEFWFNFLSELKESNIKTILVSGIFRESQHFFKFYGKFFRNKLLTFDHFFVQNEESVTLLKSIGLNNSTNSGDSRIDRVLQIAQEDFEDQQLATFCANKTVLVLGSSWQREHEFANKLLHEKTDLKIIIAPHEIHRENIIAVKMLFQEDAILYSESGNELHNAKVLIIDTIGLLSKIYRYANFALIGGGFGSGIHNILEAAVYAKPVIFGPNYKKFNEAVELIDRNAAYAVKNYHDFKKTVEKLMIEENYKLSANAAAEYTKEKAGATSTIYQYIEKSISA